MEYDNDGKMNLRRWIEYNFNGITSVYEIYHQYTYLGIPIVPRDEFLELLQKIGFEVITKRKQVKKVKYTKFIII